MATSQQIAKLDKSLEISEIIIELLNDRCDGECQNHAMMCTRIKLYYKEVSEIVGQCLENKLDNDTLRDLLNENYDRQRKMFENVLARFREMNRLVESFCSMSRDPINK